MSAPVMRGRLHGPCAPLHDPRHRDGRRARPAGGCRGRGRHRGGVGGQRRPGRRAGRGRRDVHGTVVRPVAFSDCVHPGRRAAVDAAWSRSPAASTAERISGSPPAAVPRTGAAPRPTASSRAPMARTCCAHASPIRRAPSSRPRSRHTASRRVSSGPAWTSTRSRCRRRRDARGHHRPPVDQALPNQSLADDRPARARRRRARERHRHRRRPAHPGARGRPRRSSPRRARAATP